MTSELLDDHRDALKEKEGTIAKLRQKVEELSAAGEAAAEKINRLQAEDQEVAVQSSQKKELEQLRGESRERETLHAQLSDARGSWRRRTRSCIRGTPSCNCCGQLSRHMKRCVSRLRARGYPEVREVCLRGDKRVPRR